MHPTPQNEYSNYKAIKLWDDDHDHIVQLKQLILLRVSNSKTI